MVVDDEKDVRTITEGILRQAESILVPRNCPATSVQSCIIT